MIAQCTGRGDGCTQNSAKNDPLPDCHEFSDGQTAVHHSLATLTNNPMLLVCCCLQDWTFISYIQVLHYVQERLHSMMLQILAAVDAAHCARRRGIVGIPSVHEVGAELIRTALLPLSNLCRCSFIDATQSHLHTVVLTFSSPCHVLAAKSVVSSMATGQRLDREVGGQREAIQVLRDCLPTGSAV